MWQLIIMMSELPELKCQTMSENMGKGSIKCESKYGYTRKCENKCGEYLKK